MIDLIPPPSTLTRGDLVWGYLRDSGGPTQERSVAQQEQVFLDWCDKFGLNPTHVFSDVGKSGKNDDRDQFVEMVDLTVKEKPKAIIIWSLSRFSRNPNDAPYYRAIIRKRGIILHTLTEMIPDDPISTVLEAMYDFTNAEKIRQVKRDTTRGLHDLVKKGYIPGTPPRGYKREIYTIGTKRDGQARQASRWVIDTDVAPLVKFAFTLKREGRGHKEIAQLTEGKLYKTKGSFTTFFRNEAYAGIFKYGGNEYHDLIPPLIDRETFDIVQAINRARSHKRGAYPHRGVLSGLAHCATCGSSMSYARAKKWDCYICGKKVSQRAGACSSRRIGARHAEGLILDAVIGRVFTQDMITNLLAEVESEFANKKQIEQRLAAIKKNIADVRRKIEHLHDQIENFGASQSTANKLAGRESELAQLQGDRAQWQRRLVDEVITITPGALAAVLNQWRDDLSTAREELDVNAMQNLLSKFVSRIDLDYNHFTITYRFALNDQMLIAKHFEQHTINR